MMRYITLTASIILSQSALSFASKESADACFHAAETLNDIPSVNEPHGAYLNAFNSTCRNDKLCAFEINEELQSMIGNAPNPEELSTVAMSAPIVVKANFDFGSFTHPTVIEYQRACEAAGGYMGCVDSSLILDGSVSNVLDSAGDADSELSIDVEIFSKGFAYCFPDECDGEELTPVLEDAVRDAILKVPEVQSNLNPTMEALLDDVTFSQVCALSGLPTCRLTVSSVHCSFDSSSSTKPGHILSLVILGIGAFFSLW